MATYTWIGGSGAWDEATSWITDSAQAANPPTTSDEALIADSNHDTITLASDSIATLIATNPSATIVIGSALTVAGDVSNAGTIRLATGASFTQGQSPFSGLGSARA